MRRQGWSLPGVLFSLAGLSLVLHALGGVPLAAADRAGVAGARGQIADPVGVARVERATRAADSLHYAQDPAAALGVLEQAMRVDSLEYALLWRGARAEVNLGMLAGETEAQRYVDAERYGRRAVTVAPDSAAAHHWVAVALARRALLSGRQERIELAAEVRALEERALELDSLLGPAHHVLGRWHAEVMDLSRVTRWIARNLLGGDAMEEASWEAAETHMRRAVELEPRNPHHRLELGRMLQALDRSAEAAAHLGIACTLPLREPVDRLFRAEAIALLGPDAAVRCSVDGGFPGMLRRPSP